MRLGVLWIGLLWIGLPLIALPLLMAQNGSVIEGTASNKVTHAGVAGVIVKLAAAGKTRAEELASFSPDKQLYMATTDAAGAFRIEGVQDGDYAASFDAPRGFLAPWGLDPWCKPFHVAAGGGPTKLQIPVIPLGSVRGRVVDADRQPVARVRVELFMVHYHGGDIKTTDTEGRFFMDGLTPGAYQLRARPALSGTPLGRRPEGLSPLPAKPPEQSSEGERWIWAPTYFPNAIEISGAMTIGVQAGSELTGYEIRLRSAPVYRLRGVVLDDEGKPASGVQLTLLSEIGWGTGKRR